MNKARKMLIVSAVAFAGFATALSGAAYAGLTSTAVPSADQIVLVGSCVQGPQVQAAAAQAEAIFLITPAPAPPAGVIVNGDWLPYSVAISYTASFGCDFETATTLPTATTVPEVTVTTLPVVVTTTVPCRHHRRHGRG
jgi:hypothetical protein